ncbi:MAG: hypothetical protein ACT4P0_05910 [Panacagrimonas sp.]
MNTRTILLALCVGMLTPVLAAPPPHAPAHGYRAKHQYIYYRDREIYYEPERRLWFWIDGGDWRVGASLPTYFHQFTSRGIAVELASDTPYAEHRDVVRKYGKGSKGGKKGGKGWDKHHD